MAWLELDNRTGTFKLALRLNGRQIKRSLLTGKPLGEEDGFGPRRSREPDFDRPPNSVPFPQSQRPNSRCPLWIPRPRNSRLDAEFGPQPFELFFQNRPDRLGHDVLDDRIGRLVRAAGFAFGLVVGQIHLASVKCWFLLAKVFDTETRGCLVPPW